MTGKEALIRGFLRARKIIKKIFLKTSLTFFLIQVSKSRASIKSGDVL